MRNDFFSDTKDIHVHLDKATYVKLRTLTYLYGASVQELVAEFCLQVCADKPNALKIVEDFATKKAEQQLGRKLLSKVTIGEAPLLQTYVNALYSLIEQKNQEEET
jgi:hypothetical protein